MKKGLTIIFALTFILSFSVSAVAQPLEYSSDVTATYVSNSSETICSVDITWGSLDFIYTEPGHGAWNPNSHTYDGGENIGTWTCDSGENKITVTNHSNTAITASMDFTAAEGYSGITGSFDNATLTLDTAEGTEVSSAPSGSSTLTLNGALSSSHSSAASIGTVTVTIDAGNVSSSTDEVQDAVPVITSMSTDNTIVNTTTPLIIELTGENLDKVNSNYPEISLTIAAVSKKIDFSSENVSYNSTSSTSATVEITLPYFNLNQISRQKTITQIKHVNGQAEIIASMPEQSITVTE